MFGFAYFLVLFIFMLVLTVILTVNMILTRLKIQEIKREITGQTVKIKNEIGSRFTSSGNNPRPPRD